MTKLPEHLSAAQRARRAQKLNRRMGTDARKARNRAQNAADKAAADLRRRAEAVPGTDRAPAMARAFRSVQAGRAA